MTNKSLSPKSTLNTTSSLPFTQGHHQQKLLSFIFGPHGSIFRSVRQLVLQNLDWRTQGQQLLIATICWRELCRMWYTVIFLSVFCSFKREVVTAHWLLRPKSFLVFLCYRVYLPYCRHSCHKGKHWWSSKALLSQNNRWGNKQVSVSHYSNFSTK